MTLGAIIWSFTLHDQSLSHYDPSQNTIILHTSMLKSKEDPNQYPSTSPVDLIDEKFVEDRLLHEMIHQAIYQFYSQNGEHNSEKWAEEVNRIAPLLGFKTDLTVKPGKCRILGKASWIPWSEYMDSSQLAGFPHSLRDKDFYGKESWDLGLKARFWDV